MLSKSPKDLREVHSHLVSLEALFWQAVVFGRWLLLNNTSINSVIKFLMPNINWQHRLSHLRKESNSWIKLSTVLLKHTLVPFSHSGSRIYMSSLLSILTWQRIIIRPRKRHWQQWDDWRDIWGELKDSLQDSRIISFRLDINRVTNWTHTQNR